MIWEMEFEPATPQGAFAKLTDAWKNDANKVFVLRAGNEVGDVKDFYNSYLEDIGLAHYFAEDVTVGDRSAQRSGKIWSEVRYDPRHQDAYRHSLNAQPLHTDGSYIPNYPNATLMACVANAGVGGETTFIDADDLLTALEVENPGLLNKLASHSLPHARSGDRRDAKVIENRDGGVWVNWNYYCVAPDIDAGGREIADEFFHFLNQSEAIKSKTLAVKLAPGDAVTWKDERVLHGRNAFVANEVAERFLWKCAIDVGNFGS